MNTRKLLLIFFFIKLVFSAGCFKNIPETKQSRSQIITTKKISSIIPFIDQLPDDSLVLFDVDDTLIMPKAEYLVSHPVQREWVRSLKPRFGAKKKDQLISRIWVNRKIRLVEKESLAVFEFIKEKKLSSMALTAMFTGSFGEIKDIQNWRIKELKEAGFDFNSISPLHSELNFPDLEKNRGIPGAKNGIIFTAQVEKGAVLEKVLNSLTQDFKVIVMIDDSKKELQSVARICNSNNIRFLGFHYVAVSKMPKPIIDPNNERDRLKKFEETGVWIKSQ